MSVLVVATGGTISSHFDGEEWTNLDGAALVGELGPLPVPVDVVDVASGPSSNLTVDDMIAIAGRVRDALAGGVDGVVVVHGTDTLELTAFVTQLLLGTAPLRRPVVFTGSMRVHSHPEPDGPANLRDAIALAGSPSLVGRPVLVCLDGVVHRADRVRKVDASSVDAFTSHPFAPEGRADDPASIPTGEPRPPAAGFDTSVGLVTCAPGEADEEAAAFDRDVHGIVLEGFGDLNVPLALWGPIHRAAQRGVAVVIASRAYTPTAGGDGFDLLGVVGAGGLTAQKARLALMAALATHPEPDASGDAFAFVHRYALGLPPDTRRTS